MDLAPLDFDLTPVEVPVHLKGKLVNGTAIDRKCVLREASAGAAASYHAAAAKGNKMIDGAVTMGDGFHHREYVLVANCLFQILDGREAKDWPASSVDEVKLFPDRVVGKLFKTAREISENLREVTPTIEGLEKQRAEIDNQIETLRKVGDAAKNLQSAGTDSSS